MANILCIETATHNCSVALVQGGEVNALCEESAQRYVHAEKLHPFIESVLQEAELNANQLDAVCVSHGPGSYTGLRIGVSAAKGLCFATNLPLIALDTTAVLANSIKTSYERMIAVIDARRDEVYAQVFNAEKEPITEIEAIELIESSFAEYAGQSVAIVGDAAEKTASLISLRADIFQHYPSAGNMASLAADAFMAKKFVDVAYHEPFYLKDFIAGKPKKLL
jgi:tRNA threonylcarbamoyladenosine biosynthesis protein TsaB